MSPRSSFLTIIVLGFVLAVASASAGSQRPVSFTGHLRLVDGVAHFDGDHPFVLTGPLARAVSACDGMEIHVLGILDMAGARRDGGQGPSTGLPTLEARRLWTEEPVPGDDVEMFTGVLGAPGDGSFVLEQGRFVPTGSLSSALSLCTGLGVVVVGRHAAASSLDVKSIELDVPRRSKDTEGDLSQDPGESKARADALSRYERRFPAVNPGGPDGSYPCVRNTAVDRQNGRITILVETFGGIAAIWLGHRMQYTYSLAGDWVSETAVH